MLCVDSVNQYYASSHTLWDMDLQVSAGDCIALMGRNGVGKTTLLKTIMGILPIESGSLVFEENEINRLPVEARAGLGIAYVPQGREIFPQLTVEENLRVGLYGRKQRGGQVPELIFELFPVLKQMLKRRGGDLSGGQQQQLAIGRALVLEPKLLLLDEPTEGIQPNVVSEIGDVIIRLNKEQNITVLLVEQKLKFARKVADKFILMDRGRHVAKGNIEELDQELVSRYLVV